MKTPLVSIIVPIYNVEKYLPKCVSSLREQTLHDVEIILVDDGSPDNCPQLCDDYAKQDSRIKVIHKKNAGLGYARNSGLELATGEYVTFCDSDDFVDKEAYEMLYNTCKQKDLDICRFQCRRVTVNGRVINIPTDKEEFFYGKEEVKQFLLGVIGKDPQKPSSRFYENWPSMALFKRELVISSGVLFPSEREIAGEDFWFMLYFLPHVSSVGVVSKVFYNYLIRPVSISQSYSVSDRDRIIKLLETLKQYCEQNFPFKEYKNHYLSHVLATFKIILRFSSCVDLSLKERIRLVKKETCHPLVMELYDDPMCCSLSWKDRLYVFCMKHHMALFFIFLYECIGKVIRH